MQELTCLNHIPPWQPVSCGNVFPTKFPLPLVDTSTAFVLAPCASPACRAKALKETKSSTCHAETERERVKKHHLPTLQTKENSTWKWAETPKVETIAFQASIFVCYVSFQGVYTNWKNRCKLWVWPPPSNSDQQDDITFWVGNPKKNLCPVIVRIVEGKRYHGTTYKTSGDLQVVTIPGKGVLSTQVIEEVGKP